MRYLDVCMSKDSDELVSKAQEIGWEAPENYSTKMIEADNWGELKKKLRNFREENHVIVFLGGDEELNRKAVSDPRVDVLLHPGKNRKDSGFDEPMAKEAAENNVALGIEFSMMSTGDKRRAHILSNWRENLRLCEKHGVSYLITTSANQKYDLRAPRDFEAFMDSLGYSGKHALQTHIDIVEKNMEKLGESR